jgi:glycosyltransferase involved in cell wall biosynthesis
MPAPLVTVVCLCFNQAQFVVEALESVFNQTYKNIQLIIVDDASTDKSVDVIKMFLSEHSEIEFIALSQNHGNCKAFNCGLASAKGDYVIDLAADDVLLPERIAIGVKALQENPEYGVHFSDAEIISKEGRHLGYHSDKFPHHTIPQGDIYRQLIAKYFICPPSMMFTKAVQNYLGGYDEVLSYEDFDFWIRSSRRFQYVYSDIVLVKRRVIAQSKSNGQYKFGSRQIRSTFIVCQKIFQMNKNADEMKALQSRVKYEFRQAILTFNLKLAVDYLLLLKKIKVT